MSTARRALSAAGNPQTTDDALMGFLQGVELTMVRLYADAAAVLTTAEARAAAAAFRAHHAAHASALAPWAGAHQATGPNQTLLANTAPSKEGIRTEQDELQFLAAMEEQVASTYQWAVGRLTLQGSVSVAAVILPVECQHAVVLGLLQGKPVDSLVPAFEPTTPFLNPDDLGA
jgi:ferritin-like protein